MTSLPVRLRGPRSATPQQPEPPSLRPRRVGRWGRLLAACVVLAGVALLATALAPSLSGGHKQFSVRAVAAHVAGPLPDPLHIHESKVYGTNIPARIYGTEIADQEDRGVNMQGQMVGDLSPIPPAAFDKPVREYKAYARVWTLHTRAAVAVLGAALRAGDRATAERDWTTAFDNFLHLGAVYGLFGTLNQEIDGTPGGLPGGTAGPQFVGLHRLEMGLWTGQPLRSLVPFIAPLRAALAQLYRAIPGVPITPLVYATRSHEILEDAQRDFLSGVDVPWSNEGVVATAAGLAATNEVVATLVPLLQGRDDGLVDAQNELVIVGDALATIRRDHHGVLPPLNGLSTSEHELLNGTVAGALESLQLLPGTLETASIPEIPSIPTHR